MEIKEAGGKVAHTNSNLFVGQCGMNRFYTTGKLTKPTRLTSVGVYNPVKDKVGTENNVCVLQNLLNGQTEIR